MATTSLGIIKESKTDSKGRPIEFRVALLPAHIERIKKQLPELTVVVEKNAGAGIGIADTDYENAGAVIGSHADAISQSVVLGVKETQPDDLKTIRDTVWLSFQHFAESTERKNLAAAASRERGVTFVCYETMEDVSAGYPVFPCLAPMSEAAARIVARHADFYMLLSQKKISAGLSATGNKGLKAVVLGSGTVGRTAAIELWTRGYEVTLIAKDSALKDIAFQLLQKSGVPSGAVKIVPNIPGHLGSAIDGAAVLVSALYTSGQHTKIVVSKNLVATMAPGGVVYAVDIDQGGSVEGVAPTSPYDLMNLPVIEGTSIHYFAVPNIPSLGARTTTEALGDVVLPYLSEIITSGLDAAARKSPVIRSGINIQNGEIVHPGLLRIH